MDNHNSLNFKYKEVQELCNQMTQLMPSKRPDCGKIIETQNLLALNVNDFKIEDILNISSSVDVDIKKFHTYDILVSKRIDFMCRGGKRGVINYEKCLEIVLDYLTRNKGNPIIVEILSKTLLDYATEYFQIVQDEECQKKSQKIEFKEFKEKLNIELLEKIIEVTIRSMESFPNNLQIQINALSLCKHLFSNAVNVKKLLKLVENSINESNRDTNLIEKILTLFGNITDLSPNVCEVFVEKGVIDLFLDILNVSLTQ
jgi:hypothetical protein